MNFYAPNSAVANGTLTPIWQQGSATTAGSCSVSANATYFRRGESAPESTGALSATATYVHASTQASALAEAGLFGVATKQHAIRSAVSAKATITAFVRRDVTASADIAATAVIVVIPANIIADSTASGAAQVSASATRTQNAAVLHAESIATAGVVVQESIGCSVLIDAKANIYADSGVNGVFTAFASPTGTALVSTLPVDPTVLKTLAVDSAAAPSTAELAADGTLITSAVSAVVGTANLVLGTASIQPTAVVDDMDCTAIVSAEATRSQFAQATAIGSAATTSKALQKFQVFSTLVGTVNITDNVFRRTPAQAATEASAEVPVVGTRVVLPSADTESTSEIAAVQYLYTTFGDATAAPTAQVTASSVRGVKGDAAASATASTSAVGAAFKVAESAISVSAEATSQGLRIANVSSTLSGYGVSTAQGGVVRLAYSDISGIASIDADSVSNPASIDPQERTFIKPPAQFDFQKVEQDFVFRRVA